MGLKFNVLKRYSMGADFLPLQSGSLITVAGGKINLGGTATGNTVLDLAGFTLGVTNSDGFSVTSTASNPGITHTDSSGNPVFFTTDTGIVSSREGFWIGNDFVFGYNIAQDNFRIGRASITLTEPGGSNLAIGNGVLINCNGGSNNLGIAPSVCLGALTTGSRNTAIGRASGNSISIGDDNSCFGQGAGGSISTGSGNIMFGRGTDVDTGALNGSIAIGVLAKTFASNQVVLGSSTYKALDFYMGSGHKGLAPSNEVYLQTTISEGNNAAAGDSVLNLSSARATGTGLSGDIRFHYSPAVASGVTLQTRTEGIRFKGPSGRLGLHLAGADPKSILHTSGSLSEEKIREVAVNDSLTAEDYILYVTADSTITVPEISATDIGNGKVFKICVPPGATATINRSGADTFLTATTLNLAGGANGASVTLRALKAAVWGIFDAYNF